MLLGGLGCGLESLGKLAQGQARPSPAVSGIFLRDLWPALKLEQSLKLAYDLPSGSLGIKALPKHTPEGAQACIEAIAAVFFSGGFGKEVLGQVTAETGFELAQSIGAHPVPGTGGAATHGGQSGAQCWKEGGFSSACPVYILDKG